MNERIDQHIMITRAELGEILMKAKGIRLDEMELVNLDFRSTRYQRILPLYAGPWTDAQCPFDMITFGVRRKRGN